MKKPSNISRRSFLKGAAASALGVAAFGVMGHNEAAAEQASAPVQKIDYEVINSDMIIVGAGLGALSAAFELVKKGQRVTIIDKGPYGFSGGAGFNWDLISTWCTDLEAYKSEVFLTYQVNQETYKKAGEIMAAEKNMELEWLNWGQTFPDRKEDGSLKYYVDMPINKGVGGVFPRYSMDELAKSPLVTIYDRTMVTDLVINDGRCVGVAGLYLPTGDYRVFRAPATIISTGPTNWIYGWTGVTSFTNHSCDNTGDVDMAAYRRGASIGESEYATYDFATTYPKGLGYGWNTMLNPDANEYQAFGDKDGNQMLTPETIDIVRASYDRNYFNKELAKMMVAGAMTEDGGLIANLEGVHLRRIMEMNLPVFEKFGVDPFTEKMSIHDEIYERGGTPVVDSNMMSTDFPGLFHVRGASVTGSNGGSCCVLLNKFGFYTARCAMDYVKNAAAPESIDLSVAETEFSRLEELRTRKIEGGIRPHVIRHRIQDACGTCMGIVREQAKLEAAFAELQRIRDEDIPKMIVSSDTKTFNTEWKEAIENYNLLDAALLAVEASLLRKESRGAYLYVEYPEVDNENFNCMLAAKKVDGKAVFTKVELPTVEW